MSADAWITLVVVGATIGLLATERYPPPFTVLGAVTVLLLTGVIDSSQALVGFSNPAPITVACLYVLAGAAEVTGVLDPLAERALGRGDRGARATLARILLPAAAASAFLNNTPIVAMVAPRIAAWARRRAHPPSHYLMPLSFAAILGGLVTVMGTSTNVVVSGLLEQSGHPPLGFFELAWVGLPVAVLGLLFLTTVAPWLLPTRRDASHDLRDPREFTVEMVVSPRSPLAGRTVSEGGLRNLEGVFLVEIERSDRVLAPVDPDDVLTEGDRLTFAGNVARVLDLQRIPGLSSAEERHFAMTGVAATRFFEVVVAPGSELAGRTLKDVGFRGRYGGAVVAVHRAGERVGGKLGSVELRAGDVLLVIGPAMFARRQTHHDFLLVAPVETLPVRRGRSWVVGLVGALVVGLVTTGLVGLLEASLVAVGALVLARALTPGEARQAVDLNVVILIAASFGLGSAIGESGLADVVADGIVGWMGGYGDVGAVIGVLVATIVLTELITNNAAAVLMFPIALAVADQTGIDPRPLAVAVAIGASASFLTPIGYQTNTMVYGMGGYHFGDFARVGLPLTILMIIAALVAIPMGWPLR